MHLTSDLTFWQVKGKKEKEKEKTWETTRTHAQERLHHSGDIRNEVAKLVRNLPKF